jgi:hypothetical protein
VECLEHNHLQRSATTDSSIKEEHQMRFEGLLIKESLEDESILDEVGITKVET